MKKKTDQGYYINNNNIDPFNSIFFRNLDTITIDKQKQINKYYRNVIEQVNLINKLLGGIDEMSGSMLYDVLQQHIEFVLNSLSNLQQRQQQHQQQTDDSKMTIIPTNLDNFINICEFDNIFKKRWIKPEAMKLYGCYYYYYYFNDYY